MNRFDLHAFRRKNNLSQKALAAYLGVGQSFISQIERGMSQLPEAAYEKLMSNPEWKMYEETAAPQDVGKDRQALRREIELLRRENEELKKDKAAYWEMIVKLTERQD